MTRTMVGLIKRIRDSQTLLNSVTWTIAAYLKFTFRTTKWRKIGFEGLHATLETGEPVVIICWHQRLIHAPMSWDQSKGKAATLRSASRAGVVSAGVQERLGMIPIEMHDEASNLASSRKIAKLMKQGVTLGVTGDGPEGPARIFNGAGLEWARLSGKPIYLFASSTKRHTLLKTWDRLMFPKPFTRGVMLYQKWEGEVPRKPQTGEMEALGRKLQEDLNALTAKADDLIASD